MSKVKLPFLYIMLKYFNTIHNSPIHEIDANNIQYIYEIASMSSSKPTVNAVQH